MRCKPLLAFCLSLALAGCVTVGEKNDHNQNDTSIPKTSRADQRKDAARIHTDLAQHYLAQGDLEDALAKLKLALQFDSNYAPAHTVIAYVYERINRLPEAEANYRQAAALEPDKGGPNNNLGQFLCRAGKWQESIGYFKKAVADPFYATPDVAFTNEGICQLRMGDQAGAEASFHDAITRNSRNGDALFELADVLYRRGDAFRARAFIQRVDALGISNAAALKLGYDVESRLGNTDAARTYLRRLQSQFPDSEQARALKNSASSP